MVATNDPVIATIYETYDYGKFKRFKGNRTDAINRAKKIAASVAKIGYIKEAAVIVNEKFEIIDGQARFEYCKSNSLPITYVIVKGLGIEECKNMNLAHTVWHLTDYIACYAENENQNYVLLKLLMNKYKGFKAAEIYGMSVNTILVNGYSSNPIKNEEFEMSNETFEEINDVLRYLYSFKSAIDSIPGPQRAIRTSLAWIVRNTDCDRNRLKDIICKKYPAINPVCESVICRFLEQLSDFYNARIAKKKQIDFDAEYKKFLRGLGDANETS